MKARGRRQRRKPLNLAAPSRRAVLRFMGLHGQFQVWKFWTLREDQESYGSRLWRRPPQKPTTLGPPVIVDKTEKCRTFSPAIIDKTNFQFYLL